MTERRFVTTSLVAVDLLVIVPSRQQQRLALEPQPEPLRQLGPVSVRVLCVLADPEQPPPKAVVATALAIAVEFDVVEQPVPP